MSYFTNYPKISYPFGGLTNKTIVQDIGVYIDIFDRAKDDIGFYQTYQIKDGERPDQISQKLYGSPDYHWTFFLMNDELRLRGWPLTEKEIVKKVQREHPHKVLVTREDMTGRFQVGDIIRGLSSGAHGEILKRRPDLGQIIVKLIPDPSPGVNQSASDIINFEDDEDAESVRIVEDADGETIGLASLKVDRVIDEYNSKHHYENTDGEYVDIFPRAPYVQRTSYSLSYSPTLYNYIDVTANTAAGEDGVIYTNDKNSISQTTLQTIIAAEAEILIPQFLALGYNQEDSEAAAAATSATSLSPLKNFEVATTVVQGQNVYSIQDTGALDPNTGLWNYTNLAQNIDNAGTWIINLEEGPSLSNFNDINVNFSLTEANQFAILGNLLPGANILVLYFAILQLFEAKKQTGKTLSLVEYNLFFTAIFNLTTVSESYQQTLIVAFGDILSKNPLKIADSLANDILENRVIIDFDYLFLIDKLIDVDPNETENISIVLGYTIDDYTEANADIPNQVAFFQGIAVSGGHATVATYAPALAAFPYFILTTEQSDAYVAAEAAGQLDLTTLIGQLAFGAALTANPPEVKNFYKTFYGSTPIISNSVDTVSVYNSETGLFESQIVRDFTNKTDAYDELKTRYDAYITANYDRLEPATLLPVTFREKYVRENDEVKTIKVIKPGIIQQFDAQFKSILNQATVEEEPQGSQSQGYSEYSVIPDRVAESSSGSSASGSSGGY